MSLPLSKKDVNSLLVIAGLGLLVFSLSLLGRPGSNQGVEALPHKYATNIPGYNITDRYGLLSGTSNYSAAYSLPSSKTGKNDVKKSTGELNDFSNVVVGAQAAVASSKHEGNSNRAGETAAPSLANTPSDR